jgi:dephospho-CoA kinase
MKVVGLTGGIASGKSTVARRLVAAGFHLIDADLVARQVVAEGTPGLAAIAARFPQAMRADGTLDRQALGASVFADVREREALNAIIHPRIREEVAAQLEAAKARGTTLVVYDAPLLVENELHRGLDGVILVAAQPATQIQRMMTRDGFTHAQAEARLRSQLPLEKKRLHATWVIENDGTLLETETQVDALISALRTLSGGPYPREITPSSTS